MFLLNQLIAVADVDVVYLVFIISQDTVNVGFRFYVIIHVVNYIIVFGPDMINLTLAFCPGLVNPGSI